MIAEIVHDVEHVAEADWDALAQGSFYASHAWMRYQQMDTDSRALYVLVRNEQGTLVGATSVYVVESEASSRYRPHELFPWLASAPASASANTPASAQAPTVLVGNRRGYANRLLLAPGADGVAALPALAAAVEDIARDCSADRAWWLYLGEADAKRLAEATGAGRPALLSADCAITLLGDGFEDYLLALSSGARRRVRDDRRTFARAGYQVDRPRFADSIDLISPLSAAHERYYGHDIDADAVAALLIAQARAIRDAAHVQVCVEAERAVACSVAYAARTELALRFYAFDQARRPSREYFEICYYRPIETAYALGLGRLHLGRGSLRTKISRGAAVSTLWAVATGDPSVAGLDQERVRAHNERQRARLLEDVGPYCNALMDAGLPVGV
jgi:hypothetical protein